MIAVDPDARGLAARSFTEAARANALPATIASRQPLATAHQAVQLLASPPALTRTTANSSTISSAVQYTAGNAAFRCTGLPPVAHPVLGNGFRIGSKNGGTGVSGPFITWEWYSDASLIELRFNHNATTFDLKVDGQPAAAAAQSTTASGAVELLKLDWTGDAQPNKVRLYRMEGCNLTFGGVWVNPAGSVWYPSDLDSRRLMAWIGDSYVFSNNGIMGRSLAPLTSRLLGFDHWHDGIGSTSWSSTAANVPAQRFSDYMGYLPRDPAVIVAAMGYNGSGNPAGQAAPYLAWAAAARARFPNARIVTLGPWTPLGSTTGLDDVAAALSAASASAGADFIPISNLVNAANKALYTDADNTHPVQAGHVFLAHRIARLIAARL